INRVQLHNTTDIAPADTPVYRSATDSVVLDIHINPAPQLPPPTVAILISNSSGLQVCSFSTQIDKAPLAEGQTAVRLELPRIPLLKGDYEIDAFLLCERGIHVYEHVRHVARFRVTQDHLEVGLVHLPRDWQPAS
ncbi:MAG: Wzt carbohydrate-binding domain-containing protein, partial [Burkholderiales bacterium]|nr:Wzt carbohydrate-binding domain-containing protein [Burkholderiales bacterium]